MQAKDVREQMFEHINGWKQSGVTQKSFCEQANIPYHVFHYWYKVYRDLILGLFRWCSELDVSIFSVLFSLVPLIVFAAFDILKNALAHL